MSLLTREYIWYIGGKLPWPGHMGLISLNQPSTHDQSIHKRGGERVAESQKKAEEMVCPSTPCPKEKIKTFNGCVRKLDWHRLGEYSENTELTSLERQTSEVRVRLSVRRWLVTQRAFPPVKFLVGRSGGKGKNILLYLVWRRPGRKSWWSKKKRIKTLRLMIQTMWACCKFWINFY